MNGRYNHKFNNDICIFCKKSADEIYYKLLNELDPEICKYNYNRFFMKNSDGSYISFSGILETKQCLSDDEVAIFDIL